MYWRVFEEGTGEDLGLSFIRGIGLAQVLLTYGMIFQNLCQIMLVSTINVKSRQDRIKVLNKTQTGYSCHFLSTSDLSETINQ